MASISISLCISTYNWPAALQLCLLSVLKQTVLPAEVIIGDDGSHSDTRRLIESMAATFPIPIIHVWQPDMGFRLAQIRNKSFAKSSSDYIIQIDGDLVLNKFFTEDHLHFAKQKTFVSGARSLISKEVTDILCHEQSVNYKLIKQALGKRYNAYRSRPLAFINYLLSQGAKEAKYVLGANMAFWKKDLVAVNGYDESYEGWGKEDNDLATRLSNAGVQLHSLKCAAVIYHLHHQEASRQGMQENEHRLLKAQQDKITFVQNGLNKYL